MSDTTQPDFITLFIDTMNQLKDLNQYDYKNNEKNTKFYNTVKSDLANIKTQIDKILELLSTLHNTIVSSSDELSSNETTIIELRKQIAILNAQLLKRSVNNNGENPAAVADIKTDIDNRTVEITKLLEKNAEYTKLIKDSTVIMQKSIEILQNLQNNSNINEKDQIEINTIIKQITDSVQNINDKITKNNTTTVSPIDAFYSQTSTFNEANPSKNPPTKPTSTTQIEPTTPIEPTKPRLDFGKLLGIKSSLTKNNPLTNNQQKRSSEAKTKTLFNELPFGLGGTRRKRKSKKQKRKTKKPKRKTQKKKRKTHRKH